MDYIIIHNIAQNRFEAINNDECIGLVDYLINDNKISITHTEVSPTHGGMGIAGELNKKALEYAKEQNLVVIPICSYTKTYIIRHPEFKCLLEESL